MTLYHYPIIITSLQSTTKNNHPIMYDCFYCHSDNTKLHSNKQTSKQTHINCC
nr:MAG TPA: hypothetical protein [Crassvirales sp.]